MLVSFASWWFLAASAAKTFSNRWYSLFAFALMLLGCLGKNVMFWNSVMISESISFSALAFFAGSLIRWSSAKQGHWFVVASAFAVLFTRDQWIWFVPFVVLALFAKSFRDTRFKVNAALGVASVLALCVVSISLARIGERQDEPIRNNINKRVLPYPEVAALFPPEVHSMDRCMGHDAVACRVSPQEREWALSTGTSAYGKYLLTTLPQRIGDWWNDFETTQDFDSYVPYTRYNFRGPLNESTANVSLVGNTDSAVLEWETGAAVLLAAILAIRRRLLPLSGCEKVGWPFVLFGVFVHFLTYWADPMEITRHCLSPSIAISIGLALVLLGQLPRVVSRSAKPTI
jgi:hypothetical protein